MSYLSLIRPARPAIVDQLALDCALAVDAEQERAPDGKFGSGAEHTAAANHHDAKSAPGGEHGKLGRGNAGSMHTAAQKDHRLAASAHKRAAAAHGTKEYAGWAKHAAGASAAAEKYSKRAHTEEPNGPPQKTPQAKW